MKSKPVFLNFIRYSLLSVAAIAIATTTGFAQPINADPVTCASFIPSPEFKVMVDGRDVLVYSSPIPLAFCSFELSKPVDIVVRSLRRDIKWAEIRPLSSGIRPVIKSDSTLAFHIENPGQYSIELNGIFKIPLFIFANKPEIEKPQMTDKNVLYFESGKIHYPGTMILRDNQQVFIERGAIVVGCIKARNVNHIKIWGGGILDGSFSQHFMDSCANVFNKGSVREPVPGGINSLISISESKDITIRGIPCSTVKPGMLFHPYAAMLIFTI